MCWTNSQREKVSQMRQVGWWRVKSKGYHCHDDPLKASGLGHATAWDAYVAHEFKAGKKTVQERMQVDELSRRPFIPGVPDTVKGKKVIGRRSRNSGPPRG